MSVLNTLLSHLSAHPVWSCAAVFLAALLEAVPVFGSFVPGSTLILGVGAAATLDLLPALLVSAILGAVVGDATAYLTGYHAKRRILTSWPLSAYPQVVARSEQFFASHGLAAVFLARFVAPIRAFVPVTAGALDMAPQRFFPTNFAAILLWAPLHLVPGSLAGHALRRFNMAEWHWHHPVLLSALAAVVAIIAWAIWQQARRATPAYLTANSSDRR